MFVAASIALTVAPGTLAPEGSVTVPLIAPRKVCALAGTTKNKTDKSTTSNCFIIFFPLKRENFVSHRGSIREALHRATRCGFWRRETQIPEERVCPFYARWFSRMRGLRTFLERSAGSRAERSSDSLGSAQ